MTILLLNMFDSDVSVIYTKAELVTQNRIQYKLNQKSKAKWKDEFLRTEMLEVKPGVPGR